MNDELRILPDGLTRQRFSYHTRENCSSIPPQPNGYAFPDHWTPSHQIQEDRDLLIYRHNDEEIGRVTLVDDRTSWGLGNYSPVPEGNFSEISFIDIREQHRKQGYGRTIVRDVEELSCHDIIIALAEDRDAEAFWEAIGWHLACDPHDIHLRKLYSNRIY